MAESDAEKTEQPTPRRIQRARNEGSVPKTQELNSGIILMTGSLVLYFMMGSLMRNMIFFFNVFWNEIPYFVFTVDNFQKYFAAGVFKIAIMLAPFLLTILIVGILSNIMQFGFLFTTKPLQPNLNKINPINGFSRLFSARGFVELLKNILKI